jgi:hypothetical protein
MWRRQVNTNSPADTLLSDFVLIAKRCRLPNGSVDVSAFLDAVGSELFPEGRADVPVSLLLGAIEAAEAVRH